MLAENGLEETATAEDLLEDQIVRRRQVVEAVLGGGDLCRPRYLVAHAVTVDVSFGCIWILAFGFYRFARRKCKVSFPLKQTGTRRIGLNGYPMKQAGRGGKLVFLMGQGGAKPDPYRPIAIPTKEAKIYKINHNNFSNNRAGPSI